MESPKSGSQDKAYIQRLNKLLEESMQEAHELRCKLQINEKCVKDYEAELEALQNDAFEKDQSHAAAMREIEEEKSNALRAAKERIETWESEYQVLSEKLATVQRELDEKSVNTEKTKEQDEFAALYNELQETIEALTMSTTACNQHKDFISVLQSEKQELALRVELYEENLEFYKENLNILETQLSTQTEESKELQEQLAVTQSELLALKATPDVKSRGNSLFAEVEDNRQQMAKNYKIMLAKFGFMKKDYSAKCLEIDKLKKEKTILLDRLEVAEREAKRHYKAFVENYEIRIKELEMGIRQLKNDVKPVYLNGNDVILKFAEQTVINSRTEVLRLREEMEMRSALRLNEAAELLKTRGELAQARADLRKLSLKVTELATTLCESEIVPPSTAVPKPSSPEEKSTVKTEALEGKAITELRAVSKQKPKGVVIEEELLHNKFNPRKREVLSVPENPSVEEMNLFEAIGERATSLDGAEEVPIESSRDDHLSNEDETEVKVDGVLCYERDVSFGKSSDAIKDFECSIQEGSVRKEGISAGIFPQHEDEEFSDPLTLSPCCSEYLDPEDEKKIESVLNVTLSPLPSNGSVSINERTPRSVNVQQSDSSIYDVSALNLGSPSETLRSDTSMCGGMSSSVLKVRSNTPSTENTVEKLHKEVRFDNEVLEKVDMGTENVGVKEMEGDEANKENLDDVKVQNDREEKMPARRRPRGKQTYPIYYITTNML